MEQVIGIVGFSLSSSLLKPEEVKVVRVRNSARHEATSHFDPHSGMLSCASAGKLRLLHVLVALYFHVNNSS